MALSATPMPLRPGPVPTERRAMPRWLVLVGALAGLALALVVWAPASWVAARVASATGERVQLTQAQGTLWRGSAWPLVTGGPGSRDAVALPARLQWQISPIWPGLRITLEQSCCLAQPLVLEWRAAWRGWTLDVLPTDAPQAARGAWPAAVFEGLGAPLNTLQPRGAVQLTLPTLHGVARGGGAATWSGSAQVDLLDLSTRLSPSGPLGSYRVQITPGRGPGGSAGVALSTLQGALRLSGQGHWDARGLHFRGQATAAPGHEVALGHLLNIIGQRNGALTLLSIG